MAAARRRVETMLSVGLPAGGEFALLFPFTAVTY